MSKITHMRKLIEYQYVFRIYFKFRQEVNDEIQGSFSFIKDELQISTENNISGKTRKENHFGCTVMDWKNCSIRILWKN